jgi:hypothetical protein
MSKSMLARLGVQTAGKNNDELVAMIVRLSKTAGDERLRAVSAEERLALILRILKQWDDSQVDEQDALRQICEAMSKWPKSE